MSSPLYTILQAAKLGYLHQLRSAGSDYRHLVRTAGRLDHFLHWTEACDIYRADQLGHQLNTTTKGILIISSTASVWRIVTPSRVWHSVATGETTPSSCKRFAVGSPGSTWKE
jgi:hypothetical protein